MIKLMYLVLLWILIGLFFWGRVLSKKPLITQFAGFKKRAIAILIDLLIIFLLFSPLLILEIYRWQENNPHIYADNQSFYLPYNEHEAYDRAWDQEAEKHTRLITLSILFLGLVIFSWFESSRFQATPGKMILKIMVVDKHENRISFFRAMGRQFGKVLSGLVLYLGFVIAAFTPKKQSLHDYIAGCLVMNKKAMNEDS